MSRVDLDAVQAAYEQAREAAWRGDLKRVVDMAQTHIPALVAELRAAREVVKAARWIERTGALPPSNEVGARRLSDLEQAVRAYEQVVAP